MLLTISTTARPATDLGFLLHKHPDRVQEFGQSFGTATVFYPEAGEDRCTAALLLDVDPVALVRSRGKTSADFSLSQYVNDRPYAASSLMAVALADVYRTARGGRCKARPELPGRPLPLEITLVCRGGAELAEGVFSPLGWAVEAQAVPLDEGFPEWGDSRYVRLTLRGTLRLADALNQLYVLLPVLDDNKHYWVAPDEVDKLVRAGEGWLREHPLRGVIARRYLGRRWSLARTALARLAELGDDTEEQLDSAVPLEADTSEQDAQAPDQDATAREPERATRTETEPAPDGPAQEGATQDGAAQDPARPKPLNLLRREAVLDTLDRLGVNSVIDLGCGQGDLVGALLSRPRHTRVGGSDVSAFALMIAARRLRLDRMPDSKRARLELFQGSLTYTDKRFAGYDAAVLMEVIEHVDPQRLGALEQVVFGSAKPRYVLVTTPNVEYNPRYEFLTGMRHRDHRFEWTRAEFAAWCDSVCAAYGYGVSYEPIGEQDPELGAPTQMGVFHRD
ncbi:3' terminal RNA ribose 2'-O-methyltransferase Hen1 [Nonomuraea longicatena]|uniref:Small RNA 2'-O-methyltransferase n=1 Tax=Nonomuraea longicatena TaxID=83682 RepID=A0ABP3Z0R8_9ACTN